MQTRCIVKGEAQKSPLFWQFSGGFWFSQDRLFSRNSTRKPLNLIKSLIFTNTPCKSTCLYNAPSMHTVEGNLLFSQHVLNYRRGGWSQSFPLLNMLFLPSGWWWYMFLSSLLFLRCSLRVNLPKGRSCTKTAIAMEIVVFCCRGTLIFQSLLLSFSSLFLFCGFSCFFVRFCSLFQFCREENPCFFGESSHFCQKNKDWRVRVIFTIHTDSLSYFPGKTASKLLSR